jgi:hypothetical protein
VGCRRRVFGLPLHCQSPELIFFGLFCCLFAFFFFFFKWYLGYCFPPGETLIFEFVLVPLFLAVPFSDSNSDFTISVIF